MHERLRTFVARVEDAVSAETCEERLLARVRAAMQDLVAVDDWLPAAFEKPHPTYYQQYLLHRDPHSRFSVVSFVWGPGQQTPVHDHTVWGVIGMLRGAEVAAAYQLQDGRPVQAGSPTRLERGDVEAVSPSIGDIHRVSNAFSDRVSISIHCYGADIGSVERHVFDLSSDTITTFISGYANA